MKYYVSITETLNKVVCVEAENEDAAWKAVKKAYFNDETIVLDSEDYVDAEIQVELDQELYAKEEERGVHFQTIQ